MKRFLPLLALALFVLVLPACQGGAAAALVPIKAVGSANGDLAGPQVFLAGVPMNALVRIHGEVAYTIQAVPPYVTLDGDYTIIVEPLPGKEAEAQQAVELGHLLIRRNGQPARLNAPGSIRALREQTSRLRRYVLRAPTTAAAAPTPEPTAADESLVCDGPECAVPVATACVR